MHGSPHDAAAQTILTAGTRQIESATTRTEQPQKNIYLLLGLTILFWAANWLLNKHILAQISPLSFNVLRFAGAAAVMAALSLAMRVPLVPVPGERVPMGIIGLFQVAALLELGTVGLQWVGPGRATVLAYTMQLWALPLGWLIARDRVRPMALLGGLIGFAGLVMFVNPLLINWRDSRVLLGNAMLLGGALCWAIGSSLYRRRRWQTPFWTQAFWQVLWTAPAVTIVAIVFREPRPILWSAGLIAVLAYNWICATALCYWWWGKVLVAMPVARAGQIVCLVPITAVLMSAAIYGEPITFMLAASMIIIAIGIVLTVRSR
jgi:drug/metabolite transporter (DMT)-like permease